MITVGVPTYNRAQHLRQALSSIFAQTFTDFEVIVCDDGSTDSTRDVVLSFRDDRLRYVRSTTNLKIPAVLNRILELSHGDAIVMLHDHDRFAADLLQGMVEILDNNPNVGFVNPHIAWEDPNGGRYEVMEPLGGPTVSGTDLVEQILLGPTFSCPITACALVRRGAYEAVGFRYDERFGFLADVDMWIRLAMMVDVGQVNEVGLVCRRRDESHEFSGANWTLARLIVSIHSANVERYFADRPTELASAQSNLRRKVAHLYGVMLTSCALHGDAAKFEEGLRLVVESLPGFPSAMANAIQRAPAAKRALVTAGSWAGAARQRVRQRTASMPR